MCGITAMHAYTTYVYTPKNIQEKRILQSERILRGIGIMCRITAPLFVGLLLALYEPQTAATAIAAWTLVTIPIGILFFLFSPFFCDPTAFHWFVFPPPFPASRKLPRPPWLPGPLLLPIYFCFSSFSHSLVTPLLYITLLCVSPTFSREPQTAATAMAARNLITTHLFCDFPSYAQSLITPLLYIGFCFPPLFLRAAKLPLPPFLPGTLLIPICLVLVLLLPIPSLPRYYTLVCVSPPFPAVCKLLRPPLLTGTLLLYPSVFFPRLFPVPLFPHFGFFCPDESQPTQYLFFEFSLYFHIQDFFFLNPAQVLI